MALEYSAGSRAHPDAAWALISRPELWSRWAPHLRGAVGLGRPEIRAGALGVALLAGVVPVPALIVGKLPGRSWSWQVGVVHMVHSVRPTAEGCEVQVRISAPRPVEWLLAATYGPVVGLLVRNLAQVAEDGDEGASG